MLEGIPSSVHRAAMVLFLVGTLTWLKSCFNVLLPVFTGTFHRCVCRSLLSSRHCMEAWARIHACCIVVWYWVELLDCQSNCVLGHEEEFLHRKAGQVLERLPGEVVKSPSLEVSKDRPGCCLTALLWLTGWCSLKVGLEYLGRLFQTL